MLVLIEDSQIARVEPERDVALLTDGEMHAPERLQRHHWLRDR